MKQSKASTWREYGLEPPKGAVRYADPRKAILWWLLSRYVRIRDWRKYGTCISCGRKIEHWADADAGHYCPASSCGISLLFDELNVNLECNRCNAWDEGHLIGYREGLLERYGENDVRELETRYRLHRENVMREKEWTQKQYHMKIIALQARMADADMIVF